MNALAVLIFLLGLLILVVGAELLVRGASRLAATLGISPLVIGLTVVAFGTSSPELAVSVRAVLAGQPDLAVGNVVGSNIFNVLFILGIAAVIAPLVVHAQLVRLDVPLIIVASVALWILGSNGEVGRVEGLLLTAVLIAYTVWSINQSRLASQQVQGEFGHGNPDARHRTTASALAVQVGFVIAGLAMLVLGAGWLVDGAGTMARALGVSELIIGLTIVAAGTSLPEVATSIIAAIRGERDIAVGNVVGSNIFNIFGVLGLAAALSPRGIAVSSAASRFDIPVMTVVAVACLPIFFTGHRISRWEGALFLGYYVIYVLYLALDATGHDLLPAFSRVMMLFVIPLTMLTLGVLMFRALRTPGSSRDPV